MICPRPKRCQAAADEDVLAGPRAGGWRETPDHHDLHAPNTVLLLRLGLRLSSAPLPLLLSPPPSSSSSATSSILRTLP